ncbi:hypothetical protein M408DRAFT_334383 [Serendipita vermifera MAFF 305830]|uniref:Cyanovirin-N domain-containing protein n=1 Tax=Serendipita vermifera MAFF 305830 TaxID=933852 RepID=A0A0C3AJI2_SERVB|nr:hypothetical protein M408DRAFT_334383 [Serendipita vermifera MAFF 305830]
MSFQLTSSDINLRGPILMARAKDTEGNWQDASLDLDTIFGNVNGELVFGEQGFSETADEYSVNVDDDGSVWLSATLKTDDDELNTSKICIDEYIMNDNGELKPVSTN